MNCGVVQVASQKITFMMMGFVISIEETCLDQAERSQIAFVEQVVIVCMHGLQGGSHVKRRRSCARICDRVGMNQGLTDCQFLIGGERRHDLMEKISCFDVAS